MKYLFKTLAVSALLVTFSVPGLSEDKGQGMKHEGMSMDHGGMMNMGGGGGMSGGMQHGKMNMGGMMGGMGGMSEEQKEGHMRKMQAHMLKMHDLSNRILAESDAVKKQKLKDEQLQLMKEHMKQMMEMRMGGGDMGKHHEQMMQKQENK